MRARNLNENPEPIKFSVQFLKPRVWLLSADWDADPLLMSSKLSPFAPNRCLP